MTVEEAIAVANRSLDNLALLEQPGFSFGPGLVATPVSVGQKLQVLDVLPGQENPGVAFSELPKPSVSTLLARNNLNSPVFLPLSTLVKGGAQNRVLANSIVLEPGESCEVEALCVERGRWETHRMDFDRTTSSPTSLKTSLRRSRGSQRETWREVDRFLRARSVRSDSADLFAGLQAGAVDESDEPFAADLYNGACGAVVDGADAFLVEWTEAAALSRQVLRDISRSCRAESGQRGQVLAVAPPRRLSARLLQVTRGVHRDGRLRGERVQGGVLVRGKSPCVSVEMFVRDGIVLHGILQRLPEVEVPQPRDDAALTPTNRRLEVVGTSLRNALILLRRIERDQQHLEMENEQLRREVAAARERLNNGRE